MYINLDANSTTSATSYFGEGVAAADQTVIRSSGGTDTDYYYSNTAWVDDTAAPYFNVKSNGSMYKITVDLILANSAVNPTITISLMVNGSSVKDVVTKSYSVISPQCSSFTYVGSVRAAHNVQVYVSANTGTCTIMQNSSIMVENIS
tara:strand:- start:554 stop:997 length:444 start_codon:yes stop_codon:yes gene_type:complete